MITSKQSTISVGGIFYLNPSNFIHLFLFSHLLSFSIMENISMLYTFLLATSIIYATLLLHKRRAHRLPPGPTGLPIIGSIPFLDPSLHTYFTDLSKKYGPIFSLRLGSKLAVVISSPSLARDVLREHDNTFANRDVPVAGFIGTYGAKDIVWAPNGPTWRMLRRICVHEMLSPSSLDAVSDIRQKEVQSTIRRIHARSGTPVDIRTEIFLNVMNIVSSTIWGGTLEGDEERESIGKDFKEMVTDFTDLLGMPNVSDFFPALARFDLQGIQRKMEVLRERLDRSFERMIEKRHNGQEDRSKDFLDFMLRLEREGKESKTPFTMTHVKALLMDMFVGATDTTSATVEWALTEVLNKPDINQKLHEELNQVVGKDKLVQESHLPQLQFLSLVIKETLRLHPALPLLVPHCPSSPCTIDSYLIPAGTRVFVNGWAIQRDPLQWTDPTEFRPERYLQEGQRRDYSGKDFDYIPFGSGRRMCAGVAMADRMAGYLIATMMHSFDWKVPEDKEIDLTEKFGIVLKKAEPLVAIPTPRLSKDELYY